MSGWSTLAKASNTNLGCSYHPAVWEDNGNLYVRGHGETDINIYDIATNTWSNWTTLATLNNVPWNATATASRSALMWISGTKLFILHGDSQSVGYNDYRMSLASITVATKVGITNAAQTQWVIAVNSNVGDWGINRHKCVLKDPISGRIFLINFYMKQIYEFINGTETFSLVKTWTETIGGISTDNVIGCDAVALNGKIYLLGKMGTAITTGNSGMASGPVEITIADWSSKTCAAYPDYAAQSSYTYNGYYGTQWVAIGNCVYGYGGKIQGCNVAAGDGTGDAAPVDCRRVMIYDPNGDTWSDGGSTGTELFYGTTSVYLNKGYMLGGYADGGALQSNLELAYHPSPVDSVHYIYNPATQTITITWVYSTANPSFFKIRRKGINDVDWVDVGTTTDGTIRTYDDVGVDIFTTGNYEITAVTVVS